MRAGACSASEDKQAVIAQIKTDAASIDFAASATDTYFGGKMLYRAANLMTWPSSWASPTWPPSCGTA
jgi:hypothetical protein